MDRNDMIRNIDARRETWYTVSQAIGHRPELGNEEFFAQQTLTEALRNEGFQVTEGVAETPTSFEAVYDSGKKGPHIGYMSEYDALPDIGHACGHNLIGTQSIAAAVALKEAVDTYGGAVYVYGTPAEETNGAKVTMADAGLFDHLDAAMMAHPASDYVRSGSSQAMDAIELRFYGKSAHAAAAPEQGINALDAVIQTFNGINALRQHIPSHARIHGVIPDGGSAANVVPDYASARFYVRASDRATTNQLADKLHRTAKGAALATGARLETSNYEFSYDEMRTNEPLSDLFTDSLVSLGIPEAEIQTERDGTGSIDMGNVSLRCPAIHPYVKISDTAVNGHTHEFREAALSDRGFEGMMTGAKALALTGFKLLSDPDSLQAVKQGFQKK